MNTIGVHTNIQNRIYGQNGDTVVPAYVDCRGKWPLNERHVMSSSCY